MSAPTVWQRVNEWMLQRGRSDGDEFIALCGQWVDVALRYGDESPPAIGCLFGLVRKAWGHGPKRDVNIERLDDGRYCLAVLVLADGGFWRYDDNVHDVWDGWHRTRPTIADLARDSYGLALMAALLAAPAKAGDQ